MLLYRCMFINLEKPLEFNLKMLKAWVLAGKDWDVKYEIFI